MEAKRDINEWGYYGAGGMRENFNLHNNKWTEVNEKMFEDQMSVIPPIRQGKNVFMVGECYDIYKNKAYYASFIQIGDRYFGIIRSDFEPEKWEQEIREQFSF
jgi:hypothetical protein